MTRPKHADACDSDEHDEDGNRYGCSCGAEPSPRPLVWAMTSYELDRDGSVLMEDRNWSFYPTFDDWEPFAVADGRLYLKRRQIDNR